MAVQKWRVLDADVLIKPGIQSRQLVWPKNSPESQTTITQVTMEPGSVPIATPMSALSRSGLSNVEKASFYSKMNTAKFFVRDIVRTPAGQIHGVANSEKEPLVYLAGNTPPRDFSYAYKTIAGAVGGSLA
jgi:hypothetical protein